MFVLRLCVALLFASVGAVADEHWPQFLGPRGDGHSDSVGLPIRWSATENVRWKTPLPGRAWSSPVIWAGQVWLSTATEEGKQLSALCVEAETGRVVHNIRLFDEEHPQEIHSFNTYASPTPAIESGRVYITFGHSGTACLDSSTGQVLWQRRDLLCNHFRGAGSSPLIYGDLLVMHYDGFDFQYVVALNKHTGETVWKVDRDIEYGDSNGDFKKAFCTPRVFNINGQPQLISPTSKAVLAYDPLTGHEMWRVRYKEFSCAIPPILGDGLIYVNTGFGKANLLAIKCDGRGDVTETHVAWQQVKNIPSKPAQVLVGDAIYMVHDQGAAGCIDAKTGEVVWQHRLGGNYSASPLVAEGRVYFFSEKGDCHVIEAAREYREVAHNEMGDELMASPAVSGRSLYLRSRSALYRIENP